MIQCQDCEFFHRQGEGEASFSCDPFSTIKEPECLAKWQLLKINQMVTNYQATLGFYRKLAPLQEKMFKFMEREIEDISESDKWKTDDVPEDPEEYLRDDEDDGKKP